LKKYDSIIVGGGVAGLTMALILGQNGHKVLLLEKGSTIGGSIARFYRNNIPFDIGLHFSGGLQDGGIFDNVLKILGLDSLVEPLFFPSDSKLRYIFEAEGQEYVLPAGGVKEVQNTLCGYFPAESNAIEKYFAMMSDVCHNTPAMDLTNVVAKQTSLPEDFISLDDVLQKLTQNSLLKGLFSAYALCYGVKPSEVSFASHARMSMSYYESVGTFKGGGTSLLNGFSKMFEDIDIDIRCNTSIEELSDVKENRVNRFVLNSGEEVSADNCVFAIHPHDIIKILPPKSVSKAFMNRISSFEPSLGFFTVYGTLRTGTDNGDNRSNIISVFPHADIDRLMNPQYDAEKAIFIIKSLETGGNGSFNPLQILQPAYVEETMKWQNSTIGKRPQEYLDYKRCKSEKIKEHYLKYFPNHKDRLSIIDSASLLTFKGYLNSPDGCAYGVKQKLGQFNLFGKLPLLNLFAVGQSALLPGVVGAMVSSCIISKMILGKEQFGKFMSHAS